MDTMLIFARFSGNFSPVESLHIPHHTGLNLFSVLSKLPLDPPQSLSLQVLLFFRNEELELGGCVFESRVRWGSFLVELTDYIVISYL